MTVNNKPTGETGNQFPSLVNIREYFTLWLDNIDRFLEERDRRYETRFEGQEKAVAAALAAADKQVTTAFSAAEKAVTKAEDAQKDYNVRSNEFRGQLDDQAKTLMPRNEANALFDAMSERINQNADRLNSTLSRNEYTAAHDPLLTRLASLETYRAQSEGIKTQQVEGKSDNRWVIGIAMGAPSFLIAVIALVYAITNAPK